MDQGPAIDGFMPVYQFGEFHARRVNAPADRILAAIRRVTPGEIRFLRLLTALRALDPGRLFGRDRPQARRPLLEIAMEGGFLPLAEVEGRELLLGTVGQFWRLRRGPCPRPATPAEFLAFDAPGFAKATMDFRVHDEGGGWSRVTTETRILALDAAARRRFAVYWAVIGPWSGLIRRTWLRAIARRAEAGSAGEGVGDRT